MTQILLSSCSANGQGVNISTTTNFALGNTYINSISTENQAQVTWRTGGTFSKLYARISTNSVTASSTIKYRVGAANGNQLVTIGSGATGEFQDNVNTDSVSAGNQVNYQIVTGATGTNINVNIIAVLFAPTTTANTINRLTGIVGGTDTSVNTTYYNTIAGQTSIALTGQTTEANAQFKNKTAATLQNLYAYISANTASVATATSRVNSVAGNLTVSIGSGTTGAFEDTTHSDTIASGDLINYAFNSTVTTSITLATLSVEYLTTSGKTHFPSGSFSGYTTINANSTRYITVGGGIRPSAIESFAEVKAQVAFTASNLECFIQTNTVTASTTVKFRKNTANGNQILTIGSGTTGYFEDTINSDSVAATDEINYQIITGATGTSLIMNTLGILASYTTTTLLTIDMGMPFSFLSLSQNDNIDRYEFNIIQQNDTIIRQEFLARQQDDDTDRFEFLARQQDDDTGRFEIVSRQQNDAINRNEVVSAQINNINLPQEFQGRISNDTNANYENKALQQQDQKESFESLVASGTSLTVDELLPFEFTSFQQNNTLLREETQAAIIKDINIRDESTASQSKDDIIPFENTNTAITQTANELLSYEFLASQQTDGKSTFESMAKQGMDAGLVLDYNLLSQINALYPLENIIPVNTRQAISYEWLLELLVTKDNLLPSETQASQQKDTNARFEFRHTNSVIGAVVLMDKIKHLLVLRDSAKFVASLNAIKMKYSVTNSDAPKFTVTLTDKPTAKVKLS